MTNQLFAQFLRNPTKFFDDTASRWPEIAPIMDCHQDQIWHKEGKVGIHTRMAILAFRFWGTMQKVAGSGLSDSQYHIGLTAIMLHDIAKPECTSEKDGRIISPKHQFMADDKARAICERFGFDEAQTLATIAGVRLHMFHLNGTSKKTLKKLLAQLNGLELHTLEGIIIADASARPFDKEHGLLGRDEIDGLAAMIDGARELQEQIEAKAALPDPFITGEDLIDAGFTPGPQFKTILVEAFAAQMNGEFADKADAMRIIKEKFMN